MSARVNLQARVEQYLTERRLLGFELSTMGHGLASFAHYVAQAGLQGSLTVDLMADWAPPGQGRSWRPCHIGASTEDAAAVHGLAAAVRPCYGGARRSRLRSSARTDDAARLP